MRPWLQPYHDALEVLVPSKPMKEPQFVAKKVGKKKKKHDDVLSSMNAPQPHHGGGGGGANPPIKPYERLLKNGMVEIEALAFIRGRSIARRFFIFDDGAAAHAARGEDRHYPHFRGLEDRPDRRPGADRQPVCRRARSNGLVYCHNRMKGQALHAHVKLSKGERSKLAELAADLL